MVAIKVVGRGTSHHHLQHEHVDSGVVGANSVGILLVISRHHIIRTNHHGFVVFAIVECTVAQVHEACSTSAWGSVNQGEIGSRVNFGQNISACGHLSGCTGEEKCVDITLRAVIVLCGGTGSILRVYVGRRKIVAVMSELYIPLDMVFRGSYVLGYVAMINKPPKRKRKGMMNVKIHAFLSRMKYRERLFSKANMWRPK